MQYLGHHDTGSDWMLLKHETSTGIGHIENTDHWLSETLGGAEKGWANGAEE